MPVLYENNIFNQPEALCLESMRSIVHNGAHLTLLNKYLFYSACRGYYRCFDYLLMQPQINPNYCSEYGIPILEILTAAGQHLAVRRLLERGANPNIEVQGEYCKTVALTTAVLNGDYIMISILVEFGADITYLDSTHSSLLHYIAMHNEPLPLILITYLLNNININILDEDAKSALDYIYENDELSEIYKHTLINLFTASGADTNQEYSMHI